MKNVERCIMALVWRDIYWMDGSCDIHGTERNEVNSMDRLISEDKVIRAIYAEHDRAGTLRGYLDAIKAIPSAEPCEDAISRQAVLKQLRGCLTGGETEYQYVKLHIDSIPSVKPQESKPGWNNHQIACMLADLFWDACACNYNGIDEWLGELCDFKDTCCPNPVGVACWEQFLKYSQSRYTECGYEVRDKGALQEPKTGHCEDCKHFRKLPYHADTLGKCVHHTGFCPKGDWYCADFEPQESEDKE